ncbi:hypothetical protein LTR85_006664 [Meristemomyces frigidus]|nr:hypothetical protein LTR85_006664 [Meristemomyces frigidus]
MGLRLSSGLPQSLWEAVRNAVRRSEEHLHSYELLRPHKSAFEHHTGPRHWAAVALRQYSNRRLLTSLVSLTLLASVFGGLSSLGRTVGVPLGSGEKDHLFYLIVPTTQSDSELCKTLGTAAVLGYPTPYLLDWAAEHDAPSQHSDHLYQMIKKTREQLAILSPHDEHIMLLLDGPYSWFQLRPEVLLGRYYDIIEKANDKLMETFDRKAVADGDMRQTLVLSGQSISPDAAPRKTGDPSTQSLNVGSIIGPAKDIRALFDRAAAKLEHSSNAVDGQTIFREIFNEQQVRREAIRQRSWSGPKRTWSSLAKTLGLGGSVVDSLSSQVTQIDEDVTYEFGITVDHENELGLSVGHTTDNVEWVQYSSAAPARSQPPLPADIANSMPPFWTTSGYGVPSHTKWEDVNLLVDQNTQSIPAIINLGGEASALQKEGWNKVWMYHHFRELWAAHLSIPKLPLAGVVDGRGVEHTFWNPDTRLERDGARTFAGDWVAWADLCDADSTWKALDSS